MLFLAKELKSFSANEKADDIDPFIAGHLNLDTIENFNFIDLNQLEEDPTLADNLTLDALIKRSIQMSKAAPKFQSKIRQEEKVRASAKNEDEKMKKIKQLRFRVQMPSLLYFYCNIIEVLHLRERLINAYSQTALLSRLYKSQCKFANGDMSKLLFSEGISFETSQITKGKINFIDLGKASDMKFNLAIKEFDPTMMVNLNFSNSQAFQILITKLGVEELRSVLHYQMMQYQLISVAVEKNQLLLDGIMKGIYELDFISSKDDLEFVLPNSNLKLSRVVSKNVEGFNLDILNKEKQKLKNNFKKEAAEHFVSVMNLKTKFRPSIAKKYQIFMNKLMTSDHKIEGKLRILRSYRIKLTHIYCRDVLREVYQESIKNQLLKVCNDLRLKSFLLPFTKKKELLLF